LREEQAEEEDLTPGLRRRAFRALMRPVYRWHGWITTRQFLRTPPRVTLIERLALGVLHGLLDLSELPTILALNRQLRQIRRVERKNKRDAPN